MPEQRRSKDLNWLLSHKKGDLEILDESERYAHDCCSRSLSLKAYLKKSFLRFLFQKFPGFVLKRKKIFLFSNTGYTGEKGFEIYLPSDKAQSYWEKLKREGEKFQIEEAGLGARDTLRLEMGYLLSGQDFDEEKSLIQAGLSWIIKNKEEYMGKKRQGEDKKRFDLLKLKGFVMEEEGGIPRSSHKIYSGGGEEIGVITSGARSPSLGKTLALGYMKGDEKDILIDIRGDKKKASVSSLPFLKKKS